MTPAATADLFTYGTLMVPEVIARVIGRTPPASPARLANHIRRALRGASFPGIVPMPGVQVLGLLYRALAPEELAELDAFEGALYERVEVSVEVEEDPERCAACPAFTYRVVARHAHQLADDDWDLEVFRARHTRFVEQERGQGPA